MCTIPSILETKGIGGVNIVCDTKSVCKKIWEQIRTIYMKFSNSVL